MGTAYRMVKTEGNNAAKLRDDSHAHAAIDKASKHRGDSHAAAIDVLRGTNAQLAAAIVIAAGSALFIGIILARVEVPWHVKLYVTESCVFMVAQTFFAAKTMRDVFTAGLPRPPPGAQFMKGNAAWQIGVGTAATVAGAFLLHSIATMPGIDFEPHFCLCLGAFFLVASCVNLAKSVRDSKEPVHSPLHPSQKDWVLSIVSVAVASVLLYGYLWTYMQAGLMPFDKVLFFLVSCFFSLFSTSWVSKYLRDQIDVDALELACAPSAVAS